jgi:hypothetical protein
MWGPACPFSRQGRIIRYEYLTRLVADGNHGPTTGVPPVFGDRVCPAGQSDSINGHTVAQALWYDSLGRALPVWTDCIELKPDQIFHHQPAQHLSTLVFRAGPGWQRHRKYRHRYRHSEPIFRMFAHHFGAMVALRNALASRYGRRRVAAMVAKAASTFALPDAWLNAVVTRESGRKTILIGRSITSAAGALGLMQVMPRTYDDRRRQLGLSADPHAEADNITVGAAYLQQMYRPMAIPEMFAAYTLGRAALTVICCGNAHFLMNLAYVAKLAPGTEPASSGAEKPSIEPTPRASGPRSRAYSGALFRVFGHSQRDLCAAVRPQFLKKSCHAIGPILASEGSF